MSNVESLQPSGDKMKQALLWISETIKSCPKKTRQQVLMEAEVRFDLSPRECEFLNSKLQETQG